MNSYLALAIIEVYQHVLKELLDVKYSTTADIGLLNEDFNQRQFVLSSVSQRLDEMHSAMLKELFPYDSAYQNLDKSLDLYYDKSKQLLEDCSRLAYNLDQIRISLFENQPRLLSTSSENTMPSIQAEWDRLNECLVTHRAILVDFADNRRGQEETIAGPSTIITGWKGLKSHNPLHQDIKAQFLSLFKKSELSTFKTDCMKLLLQLRVSWKYKIAFRNQIVDSIPETLFKLLKLSKNKEINNKMFVHWLEASLSDGEEEAFHDKSFYNAAIQFQISTLFPPNHEVKFTSGGQVGPIGPSYEQIINGMTCKIPYKANLTAEHLQVEKGIGSITCCVSGMFRITCAGAGNGGTVSADAFLDTHSRYCLLIGQLPSSDNRGYGGAGGSFFYRCHHNNNKCEAIVVAGAYFSPNSLNVSSVLEKAPENTEGQGYGGGFSFDRVDKTTNGRSVVNGGGGSACGGFGGGGGAVGICIGGGGGYQGGNGSSSGRAGTSYVISTAKNIAPVTSNANGYGWISITRLSEV